MLAVAAPEIRTGHTRYNHYALLAESWICGTLSLPGLPPDYAAQNDFALHDGKWFVVFPPLPAVILLPFVWLAKSAERVPDGLVFVCLSGVAPALIYLVLEKARRLTGVGSNARSVGLALLAAFGTPFFFSAVQGTVWYAAHVIGVALMAIYCHAALGAERPLLAGIALALGFLTRSPLLFAAPLFVVEAWRAAAVGQPERRSWRAFRFSDRVDGSALVRLLAWFAVPLVSAIALWMLHNVARFGDAFEPGYRFLTVRWQARMEAWGLFHFHYLARNLGVMLTSLPWSGGSASVPFRVSGHGLALWFTSPICFWLACRSQAPALSHGLWLSVVGVAVPTLLYQNSGWVQFGYRFANDYVVLLMLLLALTELPFRRVFIALAAWSVVVSGFGALSFGRERWADYYAIEPTQSVIYEPD